MIVRPAVLLALALACLLASPCAADEPKAFTCTFATGIAYAYDKGAYMAEKASPLLLRHRCHRRRGADRRAEDPGRDGALRIVQAVNAMHFLEVVTEGFLNVTTVYDKDEAKGAYPAVHSRHFGLFGQPLVTQYQGFCEATG